MPLTAARPELCHPTDRDRRTGAANPQPAAGLLRGRAGGLWPAPQRAPQRDAADPASDLTRHLVNQAISAAACPGADARHCGWMPGDGTSGEAAQRAGVLRQRRLGMIEQHGFGDRGCRRAPVGLQAPAGRAARIAARPRRASTARPRFRATGRSFGHGRAAPPAQRHAGEEIDQRKQRQQENRSRCRISATAGIRPPPRRTRSATADDR